MQPLFTPVGSSHLGRPALLARYASLRDVRRAIDTLEGDGVDGDHLTIVAPADDMPGGTDRRRADSRLLSHTMVALAVGVLGGAVLGALVGAALVGLVILVWTGLDATSWILLLLTVWFAAGGAVLGCFYAGLEGGGLLGVLAPDLRGRDRRPGVAGGVPGGRRTRGAGRTHARARAGHRPGTASADALTEV
jgi:hypothetical protein